MEEVTGLIDGYLPPNKACLDCPVMARLIKSEATQGIPATPEDLLREIAFEKCMVAQASLGVLIAGVVDNFYVNDRGRIVGYVDSRTLDCPPELVDSRYGNR